MHRAEAQIRCLTSSAAAFSWSHLGGAWGGWMWGIDDPVEYWHRLALAQLTDILIIEERIIFPSLASGLGQLLDGFGPELGCELLRTGRILTIPRVTDSSFVRQSALE